MDLIATALSLIAIVLAVTVLRARCPWPQPWWVGPCVVITAVALLGLVWWGTRWVVQDLSDTPGPLNDERGQISSTIARLICSSDSPAFSTPRSATSSRLASAAFAAPAAVYARESALA